MNKKGSNQLGVFAVIGILLGLMIIVIGFGYSSGPLGSSSILIVGVVWALTSIIFYILGKSFNK
jgi:hypothetical protein